MKNDNDLDLSQENLQRVLDHSAAGFAFFNLSGLDLLWANRSFRQQVRIGAVRHMEKKQEISIFDLFPESSQNTLKELVNYLKHHGIYAYDSEINARRGNRTFPAHLTLSRLSGSDMDLVCLELVDLSVVKQRHRLEKEKEQLLIEVDERRYKESKLLEIQENLEMKAREDGLTKLFNRGYFEETLNREWRRAQREKHPLSILLIDIDHFKLFNDFYGHLQGDICLQRVSQILKSIARRGGDFVARYGGEEFVMILANTSEQGALRVGKNIAENLKNNAIPHEKSEVASYVTASIGLATTTPRSEDLPEKLIDNADKALYISKAEGRNRVTVHS